MNSAKKRSNLWCVSVGLRGISMEWCTDHYSIDDSTLTAIRYQDEIPRPTVASPLILLGHNVYVHPNSQEQAMVKWSATVLHGACRDRYDDHMMLWYHIIAHKYYSHSMYVLVKKKSVSVFSSVSFFALYSYSVWHCNFKSWQRPVS